MQKGSGRARMGSKRSPLIPGGGVSFGPKPKDWSISMNKKERRLAMATAMQSAAVDTIVVESFESLKENMKTKLLVGLLKNVGVDVMREHTLIVSASKDEAVERAGKNVAKLRINTADALQIYDVLRAERIVVEEAALAAIKERYK
jgi:large subunit ribosomal protein L4